MGMYIHMRVFIPAKGFLEMLICPAFSRPLSASATFEITSRNAWKTYPLSTPMKSTLSQSEEPITRIVYLSTYNGDFSLLISAPEASQWSYLLQDSRVLTGSLHGAVTSQRQVIVSTHSAHRTGKRVLASMLTEVSPRTPVSSSPGV